MQIKLAHRILHDLANHATVISLQCALLQECKIPDAAAKRYIEVLAMRSRKVNALLIDLRKTLLEK